MGMPKIGKTAGQLALSVRPRRVSVSPLSASQSRKNGEYGVSEGAGHEGVASTEV